MEALLKDQLGYLNLTGRVSKTEKHPCGGGGFGDVWRGRCDGTEVAIKVPRIYETRMADRESAMNKVAKRLRREAMVWRQLDHPNVLRFLGVCYNNIPPVHDFPALLSPLCENGNILDYLRIHQDVERLPLLVQITAGLGYLHENLVIHGDLKGSNVLIKDNGDACISDFGCSRLIGDQPLHSSTTVMSVRWSAPELVFAEPDVSGGGYLLTSAADVWSFAMVVLEVFNHGKVPWFEIRNDMGVAMEIVTGATPNRNQYPMVPGPIWTILLCCWEQDSNN
ncbi:hypothetical protein JAAARDRAFT_138714 [Jaapia argillacea MUCL 33604]|uniref:Protein kinase domain-containing protein n=1 Tax=Jaapia argillacea MUCL 33604 TaxID=933084 RepID=A0A067PM72_9AGAM|nr:hypothetical protein JAAARDRAFT_138714 [Jaapia argillacea MUCL 33604]